MPVDDIDEWEQRQNDVRTLKNQVSGMGRSKAENLIDEFGSIDALENATRDEVTSVEGVGKVMASRIGIWDDNGEPVGTINRNPCPVCGEEYEEKIENEYDVEKSVSVSNADNVCLKVTHPRGGVGTSTPTISKLIIH